MLSEDLEDLLAQPNNAILAINRRSGGPQVIPMWYIWNGEAFYFSTTTKLAKYHNIKRNPAISLVVADGPRYVAAYGQAQIIPLDAPGVADLMVQAAKKYVPAEQVEQLLQVVQEPDRVVIKLLPEKIVSGHAQVPTDA